LLRPLHALFNLSRTWFANTFRDSKFVLEIQDKETGQLFGKGVIMDVISLTLGVITPNAERRTPMDTDGVLSPLVS
jgi:hypothetical protein